LKQKNIEFVYLNCNYFLIDPVFSKIFFAQDTKKIKDFYFCRALYAL